MFIDSKSKNSLNSAAKILKDSGVLIFPTDTVYGIGCVLSNSAIKKLYQIKHRPLSQPTAILINKKNLKSEFGKVLAKLPTNIQSGFFFGKITLLVEKKYLCQKIPKILILEDQVGIRMPNHQWLLKLIDKVGPIAASSANKKGERAPKKFTEISPEIIKEVGVVIKSDEKPIGKPSAIYNTKLEKYLRD